MWTNKLPKNADIPLWIDKSGGLGRMNWLSPVCIYIRALHNSNIGSVFRNLTMILSLLLWFCNLHGKSFLKFVSHKQIPNCHNRQLLATDIILHHKFLYFNVDWPLKFAYLECKKFDQKYIVNSCQNLTGLSCLYTYKLTTEIVFL